MLTGLVPLTVILYFTTNIYIYIYICCEKNKKREQIQEQVEIINLKVPLSNL